MRNKPNQTLNQTMTDFTTDQVIDAVSNIKNVFLKIKKENDDLVTTNKYLVMEINFLEAYLLQMTLEGKLLHRDLEREAKKEAKKKEKEAKKEAKKKEKEAKKEAKKKEKEAKKEAKKKEKEAKKKEKEAVVEKNDIVEATQIAENAENKEAHVARYMQSMRTLKDSGATVWEHSPMCHSGYWGSCSWY